MGKTRKKVKKTRKYAPDKNFIKKKTIRERVRIVKRNDTRKRNMQTNTTRRATSKGGSIANKLQNVQKVGNKIGDTVGKATDQVEKVTDQVEKVTDQVATIKNTVKQSADTITTLTNADDQTDTTTKTPTKTTTKTPTKTTTETTTDAPTETQNEIQEATPIATQVSGIGKKMDDHLNRISSLIGELNGKATSSNANYPECPGKQRELIIKITSAGGNCVQTVGFEGLQGDQPNASIGGGEKINITKQQVQTLLNRNLTNNDDQSGGGFKSSFDNTIEDPQTKQEHQTNIINRIKTDVKTYLDEGARKSLTVDKIKTEMKKDKNSKYNIPLDLYLRRGTEKRTTKNQDRNKSYIETVESNYIEDFINIFVDNLELNFTPESIDRSIEKMIKYKSGNSNPTNCIVYSRTDGIDDTIEIGDEQKMTGSFHNNLFSLETSPLLCYIVRHIYDLDQSGKALYSNDEVLKYNGRTMSQDLNENNVNKYNAIMFYIQLAYDNTSDEKKTIINKEYNTLIKEKEQAAKSPPQAVQPAAQPPAPPAAAPPAPPAPPATQPPPPPPAPPAPPVAKNN
jgi:hypothetical protein